MQRDELSWAFFTAGLLLWDPSCHHAGAYLLGDVDYLRVLEAFCCLPGPIPAVQVQSCH